MLKHLKNFWSAKLSIGWMLASILLALVVEAWCYLFFWSTGFSLHNLAAGPVWVFLFLSVCSIWPLTAASQMGTMWQVGGTAALTGLVLPLIATVLVFLVIWRRRAPEFLLLLAILSGCFIWSLRRALENSWV